MSSEDVELYSINLKKAITKQTDLLARGRDLSRLKTDDIFHNLIVHNGEKQSLHQRAQDDQSAWEIVTEISEIFLGKNDDHNPKSILVSGQPGIGKTLFSHKILRDWSTDCISIPNIRFAFLITFRQLVLLGDRVLAIRELLNRSPFTNEASMIDENVMDYIIQHPEQLLVILDGFDEYKNRYKISGDFEGQFSNSIYTKMPVAALISKLIRKKIFHDSVIMITSRPGEADELVRRIDFHRCVEITELSELQILNYVEKYFNSSPEECKRMAVEIVKGTPQYIIFGRIPFRCLLMCQMLEWKIKGNSRSVHLTLAGFYREAIYTLQRNDSSIHSLPEEAARLATEKSLDNFGKLATQLYEQNRFTFTQKDLENLKLPEDEMSYLKSSSLIYCYPVASDSPFPQTTLEYSFAHLTIQEFFVAYHLVKKRAMAAQGTSDMVHIFTSGLLGLDNKKDHGKLMLKVLKCVRKRQFGQRRRAMLLRCLYEYGQDKELTRSELTANRDNRYWDSGGVITLDGVTDTDSNPIAMLLEATALSLVSSPPYGLHIFLSSLTISCLKTLLSSLIHPSSMITELILWDCQLDDNHAECLSTYLENTNIIKLGLGNNHISDVGATYIMKHLPSNFTYLDMRGNPLSDEFLRRSAQLCTDNYPVLRYIVDARRVNYEIAEEKTPRERHMLTESSDKEGNPSEKSREKSKVFIHSHGEASSRVPAEIIAQGRVAKRAYQKALEYGEVEIYRGCVKIIGQEGAGKTCLKRSLRGLPFNPKQESTVGVEVSLCNPVTRNNVTSWQLKENEDIIADDHVALVMAKDIQSRGNLDRDTRKVWSKDIMPTHVKMTTADDSKDDRKPETVKEKGEKEPVRYDNPSDEGMHPPQKQNEPKKYVPDGVAASLIRILNETKKDEITKDEEVAISIWDFAGQHLYYATHPVFMTHRAIYILVYNLGKDLDDKAEPRARQGTRKIVKDNASNETNLDNLLSWLVSVHCLCQPHTGSRVKTEDYICPPVIIVGTHADELPGSKDEKQRLIQTKQRQIENAIEKCKFQNHVIKSFFVVDNNKSADDDGIKSLHSKINDVLNMEPYFPETVPIRWFHFEKALQKHVQDKTASFLSVKDLSEIAEQVCFDQTEIATMLNFYHDLGIIIKYGDTVVLDVQWLIDLFKSLITIKPDRLKPKNQEFWKQLENTGRLHTDLVNHVFEKQVKHELAETEEQAKKDLLHMMQHFGLIAAIPNPEDNYCYVVPSHLTSSPGEEELKQCDPSKGDPCPFYIRFDDGFIPHGLYFQLVCRLYSKYGCRETQLYRNAAIFVYDSYSSIILIVVCCKSTIKVSLHSDEQTSLDFKAVELKQVIQDILDSCKEKCPWYKSLSYDLCVRCPLCEVHSTEKTESQAFADDQGLHPISHEKAYCKKKATWPKIPGLHHWFPRRVIEPSDRQSVRGGVRVSNGLFVVINIAKFDQRSQEKLQDRFGSEYDEKAMVELFGDYFGFEVVNLSSKNGEAEIKQELRNISFDKKYEDKDCFVLCIMSHGNEGVFYTSEGQTIECKEIVCFFKNDMCKSFRGKPKFFIFQACRGGDVDRGVCVTDFPAEPKGNQESQKSCAIHQQSSESEHVISRETDILQAFCCSEGYISCRDLNSGTYYIQSLVKIFRRCAATLDVVRMLTLVNKDVSSKQMKLTDEPRVKQAPKFDSSLQGEVYFCKK